MKLSDDLAQVVKRKEASRTECLRRLWTYIKNNNLRDSENKLYFFPDKKMAKIFGREKVQCLPFVSMIKFLNAHLGESQVSLVDNENNILNM